MNKVKHSLGILFVAVFLYSIAGMIVSREFVIPLMTESTDGTLPGDAQVYQRLAEKKIDDIQSHGWRAFELRPGGQGPAGIASGFYVIWDNPYIVVWINALLHAASAVVMVMILLRWFSLRISLIATLPLIIAPYMLFWFSQLNKDSFVLCGVLLFVLGIIKLEAVMQGSMIKNTCHVLLLSFFGIGLIWIMRPYINQVLLPISTLVILAILIAKIFSMQSKKILPIIFCGFAILLLLLIMGKGAESDNTLTHMANSNDLTPAGSVINAPALNCFDAIDGAAWKNSALLPNFVNGRLKALMGQRCLIFSLQDIHHNRTTLDSFFDTDIFPSSSVEALLYLPRASLYGIFSPLPDRWGYVFTHGRSMFYSITPLEAFLMYLGCFGLVIWLILYKNWNIFIPVSISFFVMSVYGMATPYLGGLYRYRYPWWIILICLGSAALLTLFQIGKMRLKSGSSFFIE